MEGDLLEVTLDEETQLWQLLQQDAESSLAFERSGHEERETGAIEPMQVCVWAIEYVCVWRGVNGVCV